LTRTGRPVRPHVPDVQIPQHDCRCGTRFRARVGHRDGPPGHARGISSAPDPSGRAPTAPQRASRRDEHRGAAPREAGHGGETDQARPALSGSLGRAARNHRAGAGPSRVRRVHQDGPTEAPVRPLLHREARQFLAGSENHGRHRGADDERRRPQKTRSARATAAPASLGQGGVDQVMKWTGFSKNGDAARSKVLPMSVDRDAMAVLSQQVSSTLSMPACIRAALIPTDLSSNGSARTAAGEVAPFQLALKGGLVIGGLGVELIFRSRPRSSTSLARDLTSKATLLPNGRAVDVQGRAPRVKVGSDPAAWVQVRDGDGVPLTDQIYVGRLGKGPCLMDPIFSCPVTAETYISPFSISEPADSDLT